MNKWQRAGVFNNVVVCSDVMFCRVVTTYACETYTYLIYTLTRVKASTVSILCANSTIEQIH